MGDEDHGVVGRPESVDAVRDDPERVDVEAGVGLVQNGELGLEHGQLEDFVSFLLTAREALVHGATDEALVHLHERELLSQDREELDRVELLLTLARPDLVHRGLQELRGAHAGDLNRVLERQKHPGAGAVLGRQLEQVLAVVAHLAAWANVLFPEPFGPITAWTSPAFTSRSIPRRISCPSTPACRFRMLSMSRPVITYPTPPSRLTPSSLDASTANSIGRFLKTSLQKPLTIIETAFSAEIPRCLQ